MTKHEIDQAIAGHNDRNAELRITLAKDAIDVKEPRQIDFHFWVADQDNAELLAAALAKHGLRVAASRRAVIGDSSLPWDLEMIAVQPIELTLRPEFTEELVKVAARFQGRYDGWGTSI